MATFECNLEEFKGLVAEFTKACPTLDEASLESGWKCLVLEYLVLNTTMAFEIPMAASYLQFATRRYMERDMELYFEAA